MNDQPDSTGADVDGDFERVTAAGINNRAISPGKLPTGAAW